MNLNKVVQVLVLVALTSNSVTAAYAASAYSLSEVIKSDAVSRPSPLPVFLSKSDEHSSIAVRDQAWAIADNYPAERYELDKLVESLDYNMESAFKFVRDSIRFDPYRGVLRGSHGTLGAQGGNSFDRSLLLKEMLETMGFETRLVYGRLSAGVAAELLRSSVRSVHTESGGSATEAEKSMAAAAMATYSWLDDALSDDSIGAQMTVASVADVAEHVWVEARDGSKWIDMDTSFPNAEMGSTYAEPERYVNELSADDRHSMTIAVVAETLEGGKLTDAVTLRYDIGVPEAERSKIFLYFAPRGAGQGRALATALGPDAKFVPVIQVGEKRTYGMPIPGIIPSPKQMTEAKKFFYGTDQAVTTALYLDVELHSPNGERTRERRVLLDRIPSKVRADGELSVEKLVAVRTGDGTPVVYQQFHQILVSNGGTNPRRAWTDVGYGAWYPERLKELGENEMTTEQTLWQLGMMQAIYPVISDGITIPALNDLPGARFFVGAPRVTILSMTAIQNGDKTVIEQSIDLLLDGIQAVSIGASTKQLAQRRRWYGVLQSALETSSIASMALASGYALDTVSSAFTMAGRKAEVLATPKDLDESVNYPARLIEDLQNGNTVIVDGDAQKRQAVDTWWTIAPSDGSTRAMLAPSLGGANFSPGSTSYSSGGSRSIGGTPRGGGDYRVYPENMTSDDLGRGRIPKTRAPSESPPKSCKAGGTEDTIIECGVSLASITTETLVLASVGITCLIALMAVNLYLKPT